MNLKPQKLAEGVFRLGTYHLGIFLIKGRKACALFEVGVAGTTPLVLEQLSELGIDRNQMAYIILSHAHADHATGQAGLMKAFPKARLVLTESSAAHLAKEKTAARFEKENAYTSPLAAKMAGLKKSYTWPNALPLISDRVMTREPGDSLNLGETGIEFLPPKGHAPGGLMAWLPQQGVMLASDSAGFAMKNKGNFPLYFTSFQEYLDTLDLIARMKPRVLAPAHQSFYQGPEVNDYLTRLVAHLCRERGDILKQSENGVSEEELADRMFKRYYADELTLYPAGTMRQSCGVLVKRALQ